MLIMKIRTLALLAVPFIFASTSIAHATGYYLDAITTETGPQVLGHVGLSSNAQSFW